jgi:hypothetical protein
MRECGVFALTDLVVTCNASGLDCGVHMSTAYIMLRPGDALHLYCWMPSDTNCDITSVVDALLSFVW